MPGAACARPLQGVQKTFRSLSKALAYKALQSPTHKAAVTLLGRPGLLSASGLSGNLSSCNINAGPYQASKHVTRPFKVLHSAFEGPSTDFKIPFTGRPKSFHLLLNTGLQKT